MLNKTNILVIFILFTIGCVSLPETTTENIEESPTATIDIDATVDDVSDDQTVGPLEQHRRNQSSTKEVRNATLVAARSTLEYREVLNELKTKTWEDQYFFFEHDLKENGVIPSAAQHQAIVSSEATPEPVLVWITPFGSDPTYTGVELASSIPLKNSDVTVSWGIQPDYMTFHIKGELHNSSTISTKSVLLSWKRYYRDGYASDKNLTKLITAVRPGDTIQFELTIPNKTIERPDFSKIVLFEFNVTER